MIDQDLLAYLEGFLTEERRQRFLEILKHRTKHLTVVTEDVFHLHNTSAVIRSCDAFGIQEVHVVEDRFGKRVDKNIALGAEQWVDVHRYRTATACIKALKEQGYRIIATTPHLEATPLPQFFSNTPTALCFGTEKEGLSKEILQHADGFLTIPMVGFSESLNVSVSVAIILQTLTQKLKNSGLDWQLTATEVLEKRLDWTKKSIKSIAGIIDRYVAEIQSKNRE